MSYQFESERSMGEYGQLEFVERRGTDSFKWDGMDIMFGRSDLLAAWVADMDIRVPECVRESLREYVDFGVFGYYRPSDGFHEAFMAWERNRHGIEIDRDWIRHIPGVVPGLYWAVRMLTEPGESVAVMTPVYYPFSDAVLDTGRKLVQVPLTHDGELYRMDLDAFEAAVVEQDVKLFVLCSPHNPVGRVWSAEELRALMEVCRAHGVYVVSDEIHHDLIMPGFKHVSTALVGSYDDILITFLSASKTFNLAACSQAFAVIADEGLRARFDGFAKQERLQFGTPFGYVAYQAAYAGGEAWLDDLLRLVWDNHGLLAAGLREALPEAVVHPLQGTYLAWVDLGSHVEGRDAESLVRDTCKLAVDFGPWFGGDAHGSFIRINLATSPENVREMVRRLALLR